VNAKGCVMIRKLLVGVALVGFLAAPGLSPVWAKGSGHSAKSSGHPRAAKAPKASKAPKAAKPAKVAVPRDNNGNIQRSAAARHAFARQTGYPNGRPGYVIDHIKPLARGGADAPSTLKWQPV